MNAQQVNPSSSSKSTTNTNPSSVDYDSAPRLSLRQAIACSARQGRLDDWRTTPVADSSPTMSSLKKLHLPRVFFADTNDLEFLRNNGPFDL